MATKLCPTKVFGHPRCGNHFLAAALTLNFWPHEWPSYSARFYSNNHASAEFMRPRVKAHPNWHFFYITREWEGLAEDLWLMRRRWGSSAATKEEFLAKRWKDQYQRSNNATRVTARLKHKDGEPCFGVSRFFCGRPFTPEEFHRRHEQGWFRLAREVDNVYLVSYDELTDPIIRDGAMALIAWRLGLEAKAEYEWPTNVGFVPAED